MTAGVDRLEDALIAPQTLRLLGGQGSGRAAGTQHAAGGRVVLKYGAVATLSDFPRGVRAEADARARRQRAHGATPA